MIETQTSLINKALSRLSQKPYANLDATKQATVDLWFDNVWEEVATDLDWPWLRKYTALTLLVQNPTVEWQYAYLRPEDCWYVRRILSGIRRDDENSYIPYLLAQDNQEEATAANITDVAQGTTTGLTIPNNGFNNGQLILLAGLTGGTWTALNGQEVIVSANDGSDFTPLSLATGDPIDSSGFGVWGDTGNATLQTIGIIYTDMQLANIEYTQQIPLEDAEGNDYNLQIPTDYAMAFADRLASVMAADITGGDEFKLGERCLANYIQYIGQKAKSKALNEQKQDRLPPSGIELARQGRTVLPPAKGWSATPSSENVFP